MGASPRPIHAKESSNLNTPISPYGKTVSKQTSKAGSSLSPKSLSLAQSTINEINYGVAELIDMRMEITEKVALARRNTNFDIEEEPNEESPSILDRKHIEVGVFQIENTIHTIHKTEDSRANKNKLSPASSIEHSLKSDEKSRHNQKVFPIKIISNEETNDNTGAVQTMVTPNSPTNNFILTEEEKRCESGEDIQKEEHTV